MVETMVGLMVLKKVGTMELMMVGKWDSLTVDKRVEKLDD